MKNRHLVPLLLGTILLGTVGCSGQNSGSSVSTGNTISGVAATGAPISGGQVEVKGSNGEVAEATTASDGSYSADVANLEEPYLVRVIAPSGEKYISVASKSDLVEGKKVNITPLTHTIVANVFNNADADELFSNFQSEATEFSAEKLKDEKDELVQKFIEAGLLGAGKIADADVDLLNGEFVAGTSDGIDGLLDVIQVNTDASAGIEIKLKGAATAIITDKVDGTADPVVTAISNADLAKASEQLSVLDALRTRMNALAALHSSKVACNGAPVDDGSACDVDNLYSAFLPYFHTSYQDEGLDRTAGVWGWFCEVGEDEATSKADCLSSGQILFDNVGLKDITLISYDDTTDVANISFNFYVDGVLEGSEEMALKLENGSFNLLGSMKTFKYWIETESLHSTVYNKNSNSATDKYSVNIKFYYKDDGAYTFSGGESFTLTADSGHAIFPGNSDSMTVHLVVGPQYDTNGSCAPALAFSTTSQPYRMMDGTSGAYTYGDFATACADSNDPCNCRPTATSFAFFDHEVAQKVELLPEKIALMDKVEVITLSGSGVTGDKFTIKKPLVINQYNAPTFIPSFGTTVANFCENSTFTTPLNLSVTTGTLAHVSLNHGFSDGSNMNWKNENDSQNFWDQDLTSTVYTPSFSMPASGDVIRHSHLYLSAVDDYERLFVRQVECQEAP